MPSEKLLVGNPLPRIRTKSPSLPSRSHEVAALAEAIGMPLMPWQQTLFDDACKVKDNGNWFHKTVACIVARQSGKTHALRMRILAGLYLWDERLIVATAQNREVARETFKLVADIIQQVPFLNAELDYVRWANGQEEIRLKNGARYKVVAPNGGSRGLSADLVIIDELREHKDDEAYAALVYTTTARPNPQTWLTSNAGDASSVVLNRVRDNAYKDVANAKVSNTLWMEWSAPNGCAIDDRSAWALANPALGHTISIDVLEGRMNDRPNVIRTEMLCQWVDTIENAFDMEKWAESYDSNLVITPGHPTWLALDFNWERTECVLVGVQQFPNGDLGCGVIQHWQSATAMDAMPIAGEVAKWAKEYSVRNVSMMRDGAAHIAPLLMQSRIPVFVVNMSIFAQGCDETSGALNGGRLKHRGQQLLTDHVAASSRQPLGDSSWRIGRRDAQSSVQAAVALAMAVHQASPKAGVATIVSV